MLVLFSQTKYDAMWQTKGRPKPAKIMRNLTEELDGVKSDMDIISRHSTVKSRKQDPTGEKPAVSRLKSIIEADPDFSAGPIPVPAKFD